MNSDSQNDASTPAGQGAALPKSSSRRRLLQAGLSASPVVLSVASRPVFAGVAAADCRSPSAFASFTANPATSGAPTKQCIGSGPVATAASLQALGKTVTQLSTAATMRFSTGVSYRVLLPTLPTATKTNTPSIGEVLRYGTGMTGSDILAKNIAVAKLNLALGYIPGGVVTDATLQLMWNSSGTGGNYTGNGFVWTQAQLNTWLSKLYSGLPYAGS